nr:beta 13 n galactosyltransferase [Hymenolepis microstoma]
MLIAGMERHLEEARYGPLSIISTARKWNVFSEAPCKWPPSSVEDIMVNGTYNITICAQLSSDAIDDDQPKRYLLSDLFNVHDKSETVTFNGLPNLSRKMWTRAKYPRIYDTYPQDVPMEEIVNNIKAGKQVSHLPKYNFPIQILETSKSVCAQGTKHDLVIVVKNAVYGVKSRSEFRAFMKSQMLLYPEIKVGYVFSVGLPRSHGGRYFIRDGYPVNLAGPAGDMLELYEGKQNLLMETIKSEIETYDDILLADYEDTYFNLTWKTVTNLRWLSAFCNKTQGDFFMIIDDDHRMNLSVIHEFMKLTPTSDLRNFIHGKISYRDMAIRSPTSKFFISPNEVPWNWMSPYPRGMSQLFGADIVDGMAIASAYMRYNYIHEDVFLGLVARRLGITLKNLDNMYEHSDYLRHINDSKSAMVALAPYFS